MKTSDMFLIGAVAVVAVVAVSAMRKGGAATALMPKQSGTPDKAFSYITGKDYYGLDIYSVHTPSVARPLPGTAQAYNQPSPEMFYDP